MNFPCTFLLFFCWLSTALSIPNQNVKSVQVEGSDPSESSLVRSKRYGLWQTTTRGTSCEGSCKRLGTDYYWCRTKRWSGETSWDYCSPYEGIDYYGNRCQQECAFQGYSYKWCYVTSSNGNPTWGYCSSQSLLPSSSF